MKHRTHTDRALGELLLAADLRAVAEADADDDADDGNAAQFAMAIELRARAELVVLP